MRVTSLAVAVCLSVVGFVAAQDAAAVARRQTNIAAQGLGPALQTLAQERGFQVVYLSDSVDSLQTAGAVGEFTDADAIEKLLVGSGLTFRFIDARTVTVVPQNTTVNEAKAPTAETGESAGTISKGNLPLVQGQSRDESDVLKNSEAKNGAPSKLSRNSEEVLTEIIVTGSRIPQAAKQGAQQVNMYSRERIDSSGQTTLAGFLATLPEVSLSSGDSAPQTFVGASTVQLRGLPQGTTLVLINGRRVQSTSGPDAFYNFFDLNNIPLGAIDRVEVLAQTGSAIYGGDAIGGVINIILQRAFRGLELDARYGSATEGGIGESTASLGWGMSLGNGSLEVIATYLDRDELRAADREATRTSDFRRFGGFDTRDDTCSPGNIYSLDGSNLPGLSSTQAGIPVSSSGILTPADFVDTSGVLNLCDRSSLTLIPSTTRYGLMAAANYELGPSTEIFFDMLYSHLEQRVNYSPPQLYAGSFGVYVLAAGNPFNPFGNDVGLSYAFTSTGLMQGFDQTTDFVRPLLGIKQELPHLWELEVATWVSYQKDSVPYRNNTNDAAILAALSSTDATTALNPFTTGLPASTEVLHEFFADSNQDFKSSLKSANAYLRGPLYESDRIKVNAVLGAEIAQEKLSTNQFFTIPLDAERRNHAAFAELRAALPAAGKEGGHSRDVFAVTLSGRQDSYSNFGDAATAQTGLEWRPWAGLLIRGSYGDAFRPPSLYQTNIPTNTFPNSFVDPARGNELSTADVVTGGNPNLEPESATGYSIGLVYTTERLPELNLSLTYWNTRLDDRIAVPELSTLVANEDIYPGRVTRQAPTAQDELLGYPGQITRIDRTYANFGILEMAGIDFGLDWNTTSRFGKFSPRLAVTYTQKYDSALTPNVAAIDRVSIGTQEGFALRWKGVAGLDWEQGGIGVNLQGRYGGSYLDYDQQRSIDPTWYFDAALHFDINELFQVLDSAKSTIEVKLGILNATNEQPQYSSYSGSYYGYDPSQSDIRGRFGYVQVSTKW